MDIFNSINVLRVFKNETRSVYGEGQPRVHKVSKDEDRGRTCAGPLRLVSPFRAKQDAEEKVNLRMIAGRLAGLKHLNVQKQCTLLTRTNVKRDKHQVAYDP